MSLQGYAICHYDIDNQNNHLIPTAKISLMDFVNYHGFFFYIQILF